MKSRGGLLLLWATFMLLLAAPCLMAQTSDTGAVTGFVTNPSGGALPNVAVSLTNNGTGEVRTTTTVADGSFNFIQLPPGDYKIVFSASGFQPREIDSFTVNVGVTPIINRSLQAGNQSGPPIVEARAENLPTAAASGGVVSAETINELPLATRNFTQETSQNAGASASLPNASTMGRNDTDMASGGAAPGGNNWTMDGVAVQAWSSSGSVSEGGAYATFGTPSPDAIQELKVDTTSIDASFGRQAGAHVNLITRSGGNAWHGSAFEFFRNTALNSNDYFRDLTCNNTPAVCAGEPTKLPLNQNQYGGVIGGPAIKNKLYIFLSYQGTWQKNGFSTGNGGTYVTGDNLPPLPTGPRSTVIGSAWVNALAATYCNTALYPVSTYAGGTASPAPTPIQCNGSNINPVALADLNAKLPNGSYVMPGETNPVAGTTQSTTYAIPGYVPMAQGMFNFDYYITPHNMLSGRYFHQDENLEGSFATGTQSSAGVPGTPQIDGLSYLDILIRLTSTINNHTVNEVRVSGQKAVANNVTYPPASFLSSNIFAGINVTPAYGTAFGNAPGTVAAGCGLLSCADAYAPPPNISGFYIAGGAPGNDSYNHSPQYQFADSVSWTHGKHSLRFGYEYDKARIKIRYPGIDRGAEIFSTFQDFLEGMPGACGSYTLPTVAEPYGCNGGTLSNVSSTQTYSVYAGPEGTVTDWATHGHAAFIQDDWKVNKRFTVSVGLRWEYFSAFSDLGGDNGNMWLSAMQLDPVPATTQLNVLGQPFFPTGGTYLGWVVPSNYDAGPYGPPPLGVINTGRTTTVLNSSQPFDNFGPRLGFAYSPLDNNKMVVRAGAGYFYSKIFGGGLYTHTAQSPPFQKSLEGAGAALAFASEQELFPAFVPGTFPERWVNLTPGIQSYQQSSNLSEYVNGTILTPLTYTWNLNVQYEVAPTWSVQVGYQGSLGIHQLGTSELWNQAGIASVANPINGLTTNTSGNAILRVPYLGMAPAGIIGNSTNENYKFNQFQATLTKRLSHGISLNVAYTLSRAFIQSDAYNNPNAFPYIPNTGYRPQRVVVRYSWNMPGSHLNGFAGRVLGGWTLSGVTTIQDGMPLTFTDNRNGAVYGLNQSTVDSQTADLNPAYTGSIQTTGPITSRLGGLACYPATCANAYVNKAAFISAAGSLPLYPGTTLTTYGTSGNGLLLGPGQFNFDASLTKTMVIGGIRENARLQFRTEFYNMFNHPQFGNPSTSVNSIASLGNITSSSVNPRLIQFGLKYLF